MLISNAGKRPVRLWRSSLAQSLLKTVKDDNERSQLNQLSHLDLGELELKKLVKQYRVGHLPGETIIAFIYRNAVPHHLCKTDNDQNHETLKYDLKLT